MAQRLSTKTISVDDYEEGGSIYIPLSDLLNMYIIIGSITITGSLNLETTEIPLKSHYLRIFVRPGFTLGGEGVFCIEGVNIGVSAVPRLFDLLWDGVEWRLFEMPLAEFSEYTPTTEAPTTEAATTEAVTTEAATTEAGTTEAATTEAGTTAGGTEAPTTSEPTGAPAE